MLDLVHPGIQKATRIFFPSKSKTMIEVKK